MPSAYYLQGGGSVTRIRGFLEGLEGPLNGRLYIRASDAFVGAPEGDQAFRIKEGEVDIELPPTPRGISYLVDWRNIGDARKLVFAERWSVPNAEEVTLDELRGYKKEVQRRMMGGKADVVENVALKSENEHLQQQLAALEERHQASLRQLSSIEAQLAAATGKAASLEAALIKEQSQAHRWRQRPVIEHEKIVERKVAINADEWQEKLAEETQRRVLAEKELEAIRAQQGEHLSLANHFGALHGEIDRLRLEKQQLLTRIEELKQPRRSASSYRTEAIAELDKLMGS
jgi:hypothetical protein